ncbi:MAG: NAD-dependent epimerase/dehydratase family protein [Candidatus Coatesbacteria bacterium]|nr:NAD-dependent epimerase/dehydratase family protein [Candidatus Coatesbacteria bacterium]
MKRIMVIGAVGQIGSELTMELRNIYGNDNVMAVGRKTPPSDELKNSGPFAFSNILNYEEMKKLIADFGTDTIYLMAAILSATGEKNPMLAYRVNNDGLMNVLEASRELKLEKVLIPSSIAAFGPETPRDNTPNDTILKPKTMYGISKVHGELLCDYYFYKYGLDVRGLRYPGIISYKTPPGGGTTDYTVEMYRAAVEGKPYTCFVKESTVLPMMYMPDALKSIIDLANADIKNLKHHSDFNVTAMSFSAGELADSIRKYIPGFKVTYEPDFRQKIADSWPMSLDDTVAREEWGWSPDYDLDMMTKDMIENLPSVL